MRRTARAVQSVRDFCDHAGVFDALAQRWHSFKASRPGRRFQDRYERTANAAGWRRWAVLAAGTALSVVGLMMLVTPGPGVLLLAVGATLLAEQSLWAACLLDRIELRLRKLLRR
jgi:hypothetical protein